MHNLPALQLTLARKLVMTSDLRQAINMLTLSNGALGACLEQAARTNPHLCVEAPQIDLTTAIWPSENGRIRQRPASMTPNSATDAIKTTQAAPIGLHDHASHQIGLILHDGESRRIAGYFVQALAPSGWLDQPLAEIADEAGCTIPQAETVLTAIQQAEPTGIFARDLAECIRLQAADAGLLDTAFETVLANLPLLAEGRFDRLATLADCRTDDIRAILAAIRGFEPKPGARFSAASQILREPDLIIRRSGDSWQVALNRSTLPAITVHEGKDPAAAEDIQAAKWLEYAVARRNMTLISLGKALIERQASFLENGPVALLPMRLADLADDCDLHESTVSRAAAGLLIQTPQGIVTLHDLCGAGLAQKGSDQPIAAGAVRYRIGALITDENPAQPLSDQDIAGKLAEQGILIARRTVAKYRRQLTLPAAKARRVRH